MRTTVALVIAHPDTIEEDYARLLQLAGLDPAAAPCLLVDAAGGPEAGWSAAPWQVDAVLGACAAVAAPATVAGLTGTGIGPAPTGRPWTPLLDRHGARGVDAEFLRGHRPAGGSLHPALDAVLKEGVQVPVGLAGVEAWLLTAPSLRPGWGLAGASRLLRGLVAGGARPTRRAPGPELTAEAVGVARELLAGTGAILDGCLWGVARGYAHRLCTARNVLLAGRDPVAVDAVAARLAGLDPARLPWLRICRDRGFGRIGRDEIRLVGATEVRDLDFGLGGDTFAAGREAPPAGLAGPLGRVVDRVMGRGGRSGPAGTAWAGLHASYQA